jgi:tetratricopeptide (TPR) repeat protein
MDCGVLDDLVRQAEAKFRTGDLRGAYDDARRVLGQTRTNGRAHYLMSCIATLKGAHGDSLTLCQTAIALDGPSAEYLGQLAACHFQLGALTEAWTVAVEALDAAEVPVVVLDKLNDIFHAVADYPRFLEVAIRKHALEPENDAVLAHVGAAYFLCGRIVEARKAVDAALRLNPKNARAYCGLVELRTARPADNAIDAITSLIEEEKNTNSLIMLYHALAREYDGMGQVDRAFESLKKGKDIYRTVTGYAAQPDIDMFAAINRYIDAQPPPIANVSPTQPIFVVGMPRSGTTVTQRILTNCDGVVSIGESLQFGALVRTHAGCGSPRLVEARTVDQRWRGLPLDIIGKAYNTYGLAMARGARKFVDKLPLNLLFAPLIVRALPNARIICMCRHPLDTVFGNYRHLLGAGTQTYGYGCSLRATAMFVAESMKLARKLAQYHPGQFYLLDYEELAVDPASKARDIIRFCGLEWNADVVKIENNTSPVGSASAAQVRTPIHGRFIGRWRKYKNHLGEAIAVLKSYGIPFDDQA